MKKTICLLWICLAISLSAIAEKHEIHIVAVNDVHATIGVFPQFAALIDSLRTEDPSLLVFSAGDNRTGNPLNDKYLIPGYPMIALMNQTGFNGSTLGNHEFDAQSLPRLIGLSNFRYICANIFPSDSANIRTIPYQIFDVEGLKVGVVGAIQLNPNGIPSTHPDNLKGIRFKPANEIIPRYEWLSKVCDVTILLSHLGYQEDVEVANQFPWFDLIIGGHTHTQLSGNEVKNGVLITQNKNKFNRVTYITLTVDSGQVIDKKAEYIDIKKYPKKDYTIEAMVNYFSDNPEFRRVIAIAEKPFQNKEELGCMISDAYRAGTYTDFAMVNPGGVRIDSHPEGYITVRDILEMDPFDNHATIVTLTGDEIAKMMLTYCHNSLYSFPYVSGMTCELTVSKADPKKIVSVRLLTLEGQKLNMKKKYRVATNNYITATSKIPAGSEQVLNLQTTDLVMQFLEEKGAVDYQGIKRLTVIEK